MLTVRVDRKKWMRGRGAWWGKLLDRNGFRCCIGFACKAAGASDNGIFDTSVVALLRDAVRKSLRGSPIVHRKNDCQTPWLGRAYGINDAETITDAEREAKLIALGLENGVEFIFEGDNG